jgi:hypothetical protein
MIVKCQHIIVSISFDVIFLIALNYFITKKNNKILRSLVEKHFFSFEYSNQFLTVSAKQKFHHDLFEGNKNLQNKHQTDIRRIFNEIHWKPLLVLCQTDKINLTIIITQSAVNWKKFNCFMFNKLGRYKCAKEIEAGATFDNSFILLRQFKNRSFLVSVFVHVTG